MAANCSADVEASINRIDSILTSGNDTQIQELKDSFGMSNVTHVDDFAAGRQSFASVETPIY